MAERASSEKVARDSKNVRTTVTETNGQNQTKGREWQGKVRVATAPNVTGPM